MANNIFRHLYADTIDKIANSRNYIYNAFARENVNGWATYANPSGSALASSTTFNSNVSTGATSTWIGQSFTSLASANISTGVVKLSFSGLGPSGNMVLKLYTDSAGSPGTLLETSSTINASSITGSATDFTFNFAGTTALTIGLVYHIVLDPTSVTFNSSTIHLSSDNTNPYSGGHAEDSTNSGSSWTTISSVDLYFLITSTASSNPTIPTTGSGGTSTITLARNTTSPLRFEADFLLTKSAINAQGQGVSYDFIIDSADQNSEFSILIDYSVTSNFVFVSTSDIEVFIYNINTSSLVSLNTQSFTSTKGKFLATFNTDATSTNYRLIFHVATTNSLAYNLEFTNVIVGNSAVITTPALLASPVYQGYQTQSSGFAYSSGVYANPTTVAGTTLTDIINQGFTSITQLNDISGHPLPAISITTSLAGLYEVEASFTAGGAQGLNVLSAIRLIDTNNIVYDGVASNDPIGSNSVTYNAQLRAIAQLSSGVTLSFKLQGLASSGTTTIGAQGMSPGDIVWSVKRVG